MKLKRTAAIEELLLLGKKATTIKDTPKRVYEQNKKNINSKKKFRFLNNCRHVIKDTIKLVTELMSRNKINHAKQ